MDNKKAELSSSKCAGLHNLEEMNKRPFLVEGICVHFRVNTQQEDNSEGGYKGSQEDKRYKS